MKIHQWHKLAAAAALLAGAQVVQADDNKSVTRFPGFSPELLADLGGTTGLQTIINRFYDLAEGDNRINQVLFTGSTRAQRDAQKQALLQTLTGTPSIAAGTAHSGVATLTTTQYNALVEDLYAAMEQTRVSYHTSNEVLGTLVAYQPSLVSAYLSARPSVDGGDVRVGPVESR